MDVFIYLFLKVDSLKIKNLILNISIKSKSTRRQKDFLKKRRIKCTQKGNKSTNFLLAINDLQPRRS